MSSSDSLDMGRETDCRWRGLGLAPFSVLPRVGGFPARILARRGRCGVGGTVGGRLAMRGVWVGACGAGTGSPRCRFAADSRRFAPIRAKFRAPNASTRPSRAISAVIHRQTARHRAASPFSLDVPEKGNRFAPLYWTHDGVMGSQHAADEGRLMVRGGGGRRDMSEGEGEREMRETRGQDVAPFSSVDIAHPSRAS